jgi:hypothetical protein
MPLLLTYLKSVCTVKENAETLLFATKENGREIYSNNSKYKVMSRDRNAGPDVIFKNDYSSKERVEVFKCLASTLTSQIYVYEYIRNRLNLGSSCYHSVLNVLSSRFLSKF